MFDDFQRGTDSMRRRRTLVSTLVSLGVYGLIGGVVAVYASSQVEAPVEDESIDVTFKAAPEPEPVKPAPPPPPAASPPPPPPPDMKVRKVKPPSADPMKPPDEIPEAKPEEGDPNDGIAVVDTGGTDPAGANTAPAPAVPVPPPAPPPPKPRASVPINLPENGVPAQPRGDNPSPEYPAKERASGVEGLVVLKIVIKEDGSVGDIQVMKGDEPFVSAARTAVKAWKFTPAMLDGQPIATFKIIKVPFTTK